MLFNIMKKDVQKNKMLTIILFTFIMLSAFLASSGTNIIVELTNSMNALFTKSNAPHFVQMHAGEVNEVELTNFANNHPFVKEEQIVELLQIDGTNIYFNGSNRLGNNSLMDHYFVVQNRSFDLLLNLESEVIDLSKGEIAVPLYFKQQENLELGDIITISNQGFQLDVTIVDFVRDVQMNPSIVHSKRFVVHHEDLNLLKANLGESEYAIEFLLTDLKNLDAFRNDYQSASLPAKGPAIDYHLFKVLNGITDGIVAVVIFLVSIFIIMIAVLCIRYVLLATMEEDFKEIGVLKALGISLLDIKKMYGMKYIVLSAFASIVGYVASLFFHRLFTKNMMLYIGTAPKSFSLQIVPLISVMIVFLLIMCFCMLTLRKFNHITAVNALRSGTVREAGRRQNILALHNRVPFNIHFHLACKDVLSRFNTFCLLFVVFIICTFLIIVPVNFLHTIQSPNFIQYMGVEKSDIRIDLQQTDHIAQDFNHLMEKIEQDEDVDKFSPSVTSQYKVINNEGNEENFVIETGDFTVFPLEYLHGHAPKGENEIALSYLNSKELEKNVGDELTIIIDNREKTMIVRGVYQDVTNGGRTAKAALPFNDKTALWYEISLNVKPHINISEKVEEYSKTLHAAKVTDLPNYLVQTFGNTIEQLKLFILFTIMITILLTILITTLFLKMLIAKDGTRIAMMRSIGFSSKNMKVQYMTKTLIVLSMGIVGGTVVSNTVGQGLVSVLLSFMGASKIKFVIDPVQAYVIVPLLFMIVVSIVAFVSVSSIKKFTIVTMNS